jgi:hypothetical protein
MCRRLCALLVLVCALLPGCGGGEPPAQDKTKLDVQKSVNTSIKLTPLPPAPK